MSRTLWHTGFAAAALLAVLIVSPELAHAAGGFDKITSVLARAEST